MTTEVKQEREKTTAVKHTEIAKKSNAWTKEMYAKAAATSAKGGEVAWCMLGLSGEILEAFGIDTIWTENYGAVCAAKQEAGQFLDIAEQDGYSNVICGYCRTGLGFARAVYGLGMDPAEAPRGGMANPSLLLACSMTCDPRYKWYQNLGRWMDTPYYFYDTCNPPMDASRNDPLARDHYIAYALAGLRNFVAFLEKHTGKKLDRDKLMETIKQAEKTHRIRWECYELRKAVPCPMPSGDMLSCVQPGLFYASKPEAYDFYKEMHDELTYRVQNKIGCVVPEEKYRLLWGGGLPPWHNMGLLSFFETLGAVFAIETAYYQSEPYKVEVKTDDPLELIVWRNYLRGSEMNARAARECGHTGVQRLLDFIRDYQCDGMVMHGSKSCRATTIGQIYEKNVLEEWIKIPTLFIESDIVDSREYSEDQTKRNIEAFIETVDAFKRSGKRDEMLAAARAVGR